MDFDSSLNATKRALQAELFITARLQEIPSHGDKDFAIEFLLTRCAILTEKLRSVGVEP